jgi:nucleoside-diphosphate-sugar epimerase
MPLIVVGADTDIGSRLLDKLDPRAREIRVFVSDEDQALRLRQRGFKVATGDVSDETHVEAASTRCFSAVLITKAAQDARERAFADTADRVLDGWARAVSNSKVKRVIWVSDDAPPETGVAEVAIVSPSQPAFVDTIVELDEVESLS